jgi:hypothetical protein
MKTLNKTLAIASLLLALPGCSVYKVLDQPGPADISGVGIGTQRQLLISRLGPPKMIDTDKKGRKMDFFEFQSGFHQASKIRAIPYLAADVFTLTLAEILLWPLEMTVLDASTCIATATYDDDYKITDWTLSKKSGEQGC